MRRWLPLAVVLLAGFVALLDVTIVNVALAQVQWDLDARYEAIQWFVAATRFRSVLITGGRRDDILGRKQMFLLGVASFSVGSQPTYEGS